MVSQKTHFQNAVGAAPLVSGNLFFGRFLQRLSLIKSSQIMFMVKFGRTVLNVGL